MPLHGAGTLRLRLREYRPPVYISLADRTGGKKDPGTEPPAGPGVAFRLSPVILWLGIVSMATDISSESVSAILPLYVTGFLGLSTIAFGFIDGLNQGASAIVRIAAGWASDRTGHPKRVAVAGYGLSMLARIGLLFAGGILVTHRDHRRRPHRQGHPQRAAGRPDLG